MLDSKKIFKWQNINRIYSKVYKGSLSLELFDHPVFKRRCKANSNTKKRRFKIVKALNLL